MNGFNFNSPKSGQQQQQPFQSPAPNNQSLFGTPSVSGSPLFGNLATPSTPFGTSSPQVSAPNPFNALGSQPAAPSFGKPTLGGATGGSVFGSAATFGQTTGQASPFGPNTTTSFGAAPIGIYGQTNSTGAYVPTSHAPSIASSPFGQTGSPAPAYNPTSKQSTTFGQTASIFGQTSITESSFNQVANQTNMFSSTTATTVPSFYNQTANQSVFSSPSNAPPAFGSTQPSTSVFGAPPSSTPSFGAATNVFGQSGGFGQQSNTLSSTQNIFGNMSSKPQTQTASMGFNSPAPVNPQPTAFGQQAQVNTMSAFGQPAVSTQPTVFGQSAVPAPSSVFGQSAVSAPSTVFGQSAVSAQPTAFGQSAVSAPSTLFGQSAVSTPPTAFGISAVSAPPTAFGQSAVSAPSTLFGQSAVSTPPTAFGISAVSAPPTAFGQSAVSAPSTLFGQSAVSAPPTAFGISAVSTPPTAFGQSAVSAPPTAFGQPAVPNVIPLMPQPNNTTFSPFSQPLVAAVVMPGQTPINLTMPTGAALIPPVALAPTPAIIPPVSLPTVFGLPAVQNTPLVAPVTIAPVTTASMTSLFGNAKNVMTAVANKMAPLFGPTVTTAATTVVTTTLTPIISTQNGSTIGNLMSPAGPGSTIGTVMTSSGPLPVILASTAFPPIMVPLNKEATPTPVAPATTQDDLAKEFASISSNVRNERLHNESIYGSTRPPGGIYGSRKNVITAASTFIPSESASKNGLGGIEPIKSTPVKTTKTIMDENVPPEILATINNFKQYRASCFKAKEKCNNNEYKYLMEQKLNISLFQKSLNELSVEIKLYMANLLKLKAETQLETKNVDLMCNIYLSAKKTDSANPDRYLITIMDSFMDLLAHQNMTVSKIESNINVNIITFMDTENTQDVSELMQELSSNFVSLSSDLSSLVSVATNFKYYYKLQKDDLPRSESLHSRLGIEDPSFKKYESIVSEKLKPFAINYAPGPDPFDSLIIKDDDAARKLCEYQSTNVMPQFGVVNKSLLNDK